MHASRYSLVNPQRDTFTSDWHPQLAEGLAGFPRCVALPASAGGELCWPDFATFIEDADARQMMYYPSAASEFSVNVIFEKSGAGWLRCFYCDAQVLR